MFQQNKAICRTVSSNISFIDKCEIVLKKQNRTKRKSEKLY